jgi:hypothetical protein
MVSQVGNLSGGVGNLFARGVEQVMAAVRKPDDPASAASAALDTPLGWHPFRARPLLLHALCLQNG